MTQHDARIDELEIRIAHQDKTIAELNDIVTSLWKKLEMVERQLRRLGEELEAMEQPEAPANQKPPHY